MNEHVFKRNILAEFQSHHYHAGNPEENDIVACNEHARRIELLQLFRFFRPAHRFKRPETRAEPRVEYVLILMKMRRSAMRTYFHVFIFHNCHAAVVAVPCRNAVTPPKLTGNAPVADIFQPVAVDFRKSFRNEFDFAGFYSVNGRSSQTLHLHEPLFGNERFHRCRTARAVTYGMFMVFNAQKVACFLQIGNELFSAFVTVEPCIFACIVRHRTVVVDYDNLFQIMTLTHIKIVRVMRRRYFYCACTELRVYIAVGKQRNTAADNRQNKCLAD